MNYKTSFQPKDFGSELNALRFLMTSCIYDNVNTMLVVRVVAVNEETIDVQTVIGDIDINGGNLDTYQIKGVRYIQWQYGKNAIKAVPEIGDIGILVISQQDLSGIKSGQAVYDSHYNIGDGVYIGGLYGMNQEPTQFVEFKNDELNITGTGTINISAPTVNIKDATAINLGDNGLPIVRDGDQVLSGTTVIGTVKASSVITKSA